MPRYIDREQALSHPFANGKYDKENANEDFIRGFESYKEWLEHIPTADVVEVKHGKWLEHQNGRWIYAKCSVCGTIHDVGTNYCPNCGADMRAERCDGNNGTETQ